MTKLVKSRKLIGGKTGKKYRSTPIRKIAPRTKLNSDIGASDFESMLPHGWSAEYKGKTFQPRGGPRSKFDRVRLRTKDGNHIDLHLIEHSDYIELEGIFTEQKRRGHGTVAMNTLKEYADAKNKGLMVRDVSNEAFFNRFSWLNKSPDPLSDYGANPNYVYNISWRKAEPLIVIPQEE